MNDRPIRAACAAASRVVDLATDLLAAANRAERERLLDEAENATREMVLHFRQVRQQNKEAA